MIHYWSVLLTLFYLCCSGYWFVDGATDKGWLGLALGTLAATIAILSRRPARAREALTR